MKTRSQICSKLVYEHILPLKQAIDTAQNETEKKKLEKRAKQYGSLCHKFPLMVLRSGLSQAVAFVWVKSNGNSGEAYKDFLKHLAKLTRLNENPATFQDQVNKADLMEYQRLTRKILAGSLWYKRFAESMLQVKAGEDAAEGDN